MKINQKLQGLREDRDETRDYLSRKISVSTKQIERWEKGESEMGIEKLKKICEHYKVSANYMLDLPETYDRTKEEILERKRAKNNYINKDIVEEILLFHQYQGNIQGDIDAALRNIFAYEEE